VAHSDGALADGVHDGDRNVQQILAFRLLVDVADVQPTVSVGEGFPPPELIAVEVPDGGRHACDQGSPLVRHQDVLILAGPDTEPVPKKEQRPSMDETREKPVPASPVSLPQRAALQQPGLSRLRLLHPVGVVGRRDRLSAMRRFLRHGMTRSTSPFRSGPKAVTARKRSPKSSRLRRHSWSAEIASMSAKTCLSGIWHPKCSSSLASLLIRLLVLS